MRTNSYTLANLVVFCRQYEKQHTQQAIKSSHSNPQHTKTSSTIYCWQFHCLHMCVCSRNPIWCKNGTLRSLWMKKFIIQTVLRHNAYLCNKLIPFMRFKQPFWRCVRCKWHHWDFYLHIYYALVSLSLPFSLLHYAWILILCAIFMHVQIKLRCDLKVRECV